MNSYLHKLEINSNRKKISYRDLMIFIVPILIFSLYLFIYNPGIITTESFNQLHQIATGQFNNSQPFFHTFIEMIILKIFGTPLAIAFLQILVFSTIWTIICKYHRDDTKENSNQFVMQFIVTLIICLIPINAVYSIALWKEILFSYSLLFLCFLIKVMIDKSGQIDLKFAIIMAVTIAIASQLSPNGLLIAIFSLIAIAYYLFTKNKNNKIFLIVPAIAIICIFLLASLNIVYDVQDNPKSDADGFGSSAIVWDITRNDDWGGEVYYIYNDGAHLKNAQEKYFKSINQTPTASYETLTSPNLGQDNYNSINSYVTAFKDNHILDTLFNSPALYMYLAIILLILMQIITKSNEMYLVYVPNLLNIIGVFLKCPVQENRFLYGNLLVFYLLIIIFINLYIKSDKITLPISLDTYTTKKQENNLNSYENTQDSNKSVYENKYDSNENQFENIELNSYDLTLEEVNSNLEELTQEEETPQNKETQNEPSSDLIDEILKEIGTEKENKD